MAVHFQKTVLDLDFDPFLKADYSCVSLDSPVAHQKRNLGDLYTEFGGYPDSFNEKNTGLKQLWWSSEQIDYIAIGEQLGMEVITVSSLLQQPGNIIPLHLDAFYQLSKIAPHRVKNSVRANIFLQDADIGHMIQFVIDGQCVTDTSWKSGHGYQFDCNVPHLSCNAGLRPKHTLQISGFLNI